jgi:Spy/CpxP family protein refolding chaperone
MVLAKSREADGCGRKTRTAKPSRTWALIGLLVSAHLLPTHAAGEPPPQSDHAELAGAGAALTRAIETEPPALPKPSLTPTRGRVNHLYHLGAKQFYLDKAKGLALTDEQATRLRLLWEFDQEEKARYRDAVTRAERELWRLTGGEEPSLPAIEAAVRAVERLKADRRVSFVGRVAEAAAVLTVHQREMLRMAKATR